MRALLLAAAGAAALVLGVAGPAAAHVEVTPSSAAPGVFATLTFTVPTESETASTTALTVELPKDVPFSSVLTQAVPGWTVRTAGTTPVTEVVWTATDGGVRPGQFATFALSVGPLPTTGTVFLPVVQHYSDGTDVGWVQQAQGDAEAEHPAPSVVIEPVAALTEPAAASAGGWAVGLGVTGIVLALLAGGVAGAALARGRSGPG